MTAQPRRLPTTMPRSASYRASSASSPCSATRLASPQAIPASVGYAKPSRPCPTAYGPPNPANGVSCRPDRWMPGRAPTCTARTSGLPGAQRPGRSPAHQPDYGAGPTLPPAPLPAVEALPSPCVAAAPRIHAVEKGPYPGRCCVRSPFPSAARVRRTPAISCEARAPRGPWTMTAQPRCRPTTMPRSASHRASSASSPCSAALYPLHERRRHEAVPAFVRSLPECLRQPEPNEASTGSGSAPGAVERPPASPLAQECRGAKHRNA